MKIKYIVVILFLTSFMARGQYDARKFTMLYRYKTHLELLADQLFTLAAFNSYDPYNEKIKYRLALQVNNFQNIIDSMIVELPEDEKLQKRYLQVDEDWNFYNTYLQKNQLSRYDWEQLERIRTKLKTDLEHLGNDLLFFTDLSNAFLSSIQRIKKINENVSMALLSSVMKKMYEEPPVRIENERALIEKVSKLLYKADKRFEPQSPENKLITKMKADMNTFYMAFNNHYDPKILFGTFIRFTDKINELNKRLFHSLER